MQTLVHQQTTIYKNPFYDSRNKIFPQITEQNRLKSPNKTASNHRIKLPQITEQNRLKSPKNFNFLWWFVVGTNYNEGEIGVSHPRLGNNSAYEVILTGINIRYYS